MSEPSAGAERIAIVGAGLAGCLLAALLARRGLEVTVYERRPDPRVAGPERGRSINLAISARGLEALDQVGLREQALGRALPMHGRMVHSATGVPGRSVGAGWLGKNSFRPYSADGSQAINSISRAELNSQLLSFAERLDGVSIRFGCRLSHLDLDAGTLFFETSDAGTGDAGTGDAGVEETKADIVLAADGAYSAARRAVTFRPGFSFSQDYLEHGYKELTIPPLPGSGDFALDPDALHIWPRGSSMMIALPNLDRSFTCTLFWTGEEFAALDSPSSVRAHFESVYPDVVGLMPSLVSDYQENPVGSLATIRCWPWTHGASGTNGSSGMNGASGTNGGAGAMLALVGDAAHAIVPFFGQGANCALEDCLEIDRCLSAAGGSWPAALSLYQTRRKSNCDAIAEMALDNFVEMRDRVNSPVFRLATEGRHFLERRLPGRYVSRYELVSFSTMPYAEIPGRMRRQDRLTAAAVAGGAALLGFAARGVMRSGRGRGRVGAGAGVGGGRK
jgi:kynurenine 3-monooxygenase